jgi:hypothetical protein
MIPTQSHGAQQGSAAPRSAATTAPAPASDSVAAAAAGQQRVGARGRRRDGGSTRASGGKRGHEGARGRCVGGEERGALFRVACGRQQHKPHPSSRFLSLEEHNISVFSASVVGSKTGRGAEAEGHRRRRRSRIVGSRQRGSSPRDNTVSFAAQSRICNGRRRRNGATPLYGRCSSGCGASAVTCALAARDAGCAGRCRRRVAPTLCSLRGACC